MTNSELSPAQPQLIQQRIPDSLDGYRFDQIAAQLFPDYSRSRLQSWIKSGALSCDGQTLKPKEKLESGRLLALTVELQEEVTWLAEDIPIDIVYEDDDIMVVNKPAGMVVHPAIGHSGGTLLNALLFHFPPIRAVPRAGIVHRLDKDTTGLMVVAKTLSAHSDLVEQLRERSVSRHYTAIVQGVMTGGGSVEAEMGRHPKQRQKMAVVDQDGKYALTHYRLKKKYRTYSLIHCQLETGRTHQIRVHMAHIRYPLLGDAVYGGRAKIPKAASPDLINCLRDFSRQALHAHRLGLIHPRDQEYREWEAPIPQDMVDLLAMLEIDLKAVDL